MHTSIARLRWFATLGLLVVACDDTPVDATSTSSSSEGGSTVAASSGESGATTSCGDDCGQSSSSSGLHGCSEEGGSSSEAGEVGSSDDGQGTSTDGGGSETTTGSTTSTTETSTDSGVESSSSSDDGGIPSPPSAIADVLYTRQDVDLELAAAGLLANDLDPDGDVLVVVDADAVSERGATVTVAADGSVDYQPPAGFWGSDRFDYVVSDGVFEAAGEVTVHVAPIEVELSGFYTTTEGFRIDGEAPGGEQAGSAVADAGDVNGDGLDDVLVAAAFADDGFEQDTGRVSVVFGTTSHDAVSLEQIAAGEGGFEITGENYGDQAGWSVAGAGDVNGDGLADMIVGAPFTDQAGFSTGRAYVVFGKLDTAAVSLADIVAGDGGFVIDGDGFSGWLGTSVSAAGDIDGDGLDDVVVGAPFVAIDGYAQGRTYVVWGKADGDVVLSTDVALGVGGFVIDGVAPGDSAGTSVSAGGDVNGDGVPDVIVGAPEGGTEGRVYVVFGGAGLTTVDLADVEAGQGGFAIVGELAGDMLGHAVANAGDVDGDGLADLLLGTPSTDDHGMLTGRAYVVWGKPDGDAVDLVDVRAGAGGFAMIGEQAIDQAGWAVAAAGDVDADGLADVVVGSNGAGLDGQQRGRAYVVYGGYAGPELELGDVGTGGVGYIIDGDNSGAYAGSAVGGGGDVDGDGVDDVIVGASYDLAQAGRVYVVPGVPTDPS